MINLEARFPGLFFDVETVEKRTPKPLPSMTQVMSAVLQNAGVQTPALASDLADAAEEFVKMRDAANSTAKVVTPIRS